MDITVYKRAGFDAAHFLPNYVGKCSVMHGHHWVVEVGIRGLLDPKTGMVVDFTRLSAFLKEDIVTTLDHHTVNDTVPNPTAENIAFWVAKRFRIILPELYPESRYILPRLAVVRVWETEDSYAEVLP
jgi:6-pyruvoyltetrahydropterin/6-carboxytetrahydropterin synthase